MEKKYVKKHGNPNKDGLYTTENGIMLFFKSNWYYYTSTDSFQTTYNDSSFPYKKDPDYYFEESEQ